MLYVKVFHIHILNKFFKGIARIMRESIEESKESTRKASVIQKIAGTLAGNEDSDIYYHDNNINDDVDVERIIEMLGDGLDGVLEKDDESINEYSDIINDDDLNSMLPSQLALDDDLFYMKYVAKQLLTFKKTTRKKLEPFFILIDKSGSMTNGNRTSISRAIAIKVAREANEYRVDCFLQFFDTQLYPNEPISLNEDKDRFIMELLMLSNDGGTNINNALSTVRNKKLHKLVLITDAEDDVDPSNKPDFKLVTVALNHNDDLKVMSDEYLIPERMPDDTIKIN